MKIAIACFNLFVAGGARLVFNMVQSLQKLGHKAVIYTPEFDAVHYQDLVRGLDIRVIPPKRPITFFRSGKPKGLADWLLGKARHEREFIEASKIIAKAMEQDFDLVNAQDSSYRVGYYYKKRNPKAKVVWTVNGPPMRYLPRKKILYDLFGYSYQFLKRFTSKKFMKAVDIAAVLADSDREWFKGLPIKKVAVIRAGVEFEKFYGQVKDFTQKAAKKSVQVFALGALNPYRRFDDVVKTVKYLRDWGYDARALIVANNIWNENKCQADLITLVESLKLQPFINLQFEGVSEAGLAKAYQDCDVFVQAVYVPPPGHHGWGLVNFEAMAAGLPVVLCRSSTATEVLTDGKNVLLTDPMNPKQIAQQVKKLVDNPALYKQIAFAGQELVKKTMSWDVYAKQICKLFE